MLVERRQADARSAGDYGAVEEGAAESRVVVQDVRPPRPHQPADTLRALVELSELRNH